MNMIKKVLKKNMEKRVEESIFKGSESYTAQVDSPKALGHIFYEVPKPQMKSEKK